VARQHLHVPTGSIVPGRALMADPQLIATSSRVLRLLINRHQWQTV
jgi:hypothetical protein